MYNLFSKKFARLQTRLKIISLNPKKLIMKSTAIGLLGALGYIWIRGDEHLNQTLTFNTRVLSEITIPKMLRYSLFSWYCKKYNVNTEQLLTPLNEFTTFSKFFTRKVKDREIVVDPKSNEILCPADSKILSISEIKSDQSLIVKDVTYSLSSFFFQNTEKLSTEQINDLKSVKGNKLYQVIFYLSPGDYHRFHSPGQFHVKIQRSFQGKYKSVNEQSLLKWKGEVYEENGRKILHGFYLVKPNLKYYMGLGLVGALNVSRIHTSSSKKFGFGQQIGYFNLGSTIVMIFEAKKVKQWKMSEGQKVKYGSVLCKVE